MISVRGFHLPDGEQHLIPFLEQGPIVYGGPTYQYHKLEAALALVPRERRRHAVDVGAHCGLWSRILTHEFEAVTAFEPIKTHRDCFLYNVSYPGCAISLLPFALGERSGMASLHTSEASSGDTFVKEGGEHAAEMRTLDSFGFERLDFLKIDCEGYEFFVLKGAEATVRRSRPVVIVEQKPGKAEQFGLGRTEAVTLLESWGAVRRREISGDFILSW